MKSTTTSSEQQKNSWYWCLKRQEQVTAEICQDRRGYMRDCRKCPKATEPNRCGTCTHWPHTPLGAARLCLNGHGVTVAEARGCGDYQKEKESI